MLKVTKQNTKLYQSNVDISFCEYRELFNEHRYAARFGSDKIIKTDLLTSLGLAFLRYNMLPL